MNLCTFIVNGDCYAVPALAVEEIFRPVDITPVPGTDPRISGLINLRGQSAGVVDLARCLPGRATDLPPSSRRMLLLETNDSLIDEASAMGIRTFSEPVVLLVDRVDSVQPCEGLPQHPPPAHAAETCIAAVIELPGGYCSRIDIECLIADILDKERARDDHRPG